MTIIKGDTVIAGSVNKANTVPMEEYLATIIGAFTEEEWTALPQEDKNKYKFALIYQEQGV